MKIGDFLITLFCCFITLLLVMFRTQAAKLPLSPELAWRRMKVIDREVEKSIVCKIKPFLDKGKTHEEVCEEFIRSEYVS